MTYVTKNSSKNKRLLYKKRFFSQNNFNKYKQYCKVYKKVIIQAKKFSDRDYLAQAKNQSKAVWDLVTKYTGRTNKANPSVIQSLRENDALNAKSETEILNDINDYYIQGCPYFGINHNIALDGIQPFHKTLFLHPTDTNEILNVIKSIKNKKSVGDDEVPIFLIKSVAEEIAEPLRHIINLSLGSGIFPENLKITKIIPLHKKGKKTEVKNYRPIALLNNFSKIFERIIYERVIHFLESENLLSNYQNGFRRKKSTVRAVYQALDKILNSLNKERDRVAVCLDLSKAFDSVDHDLLVMKMEKYGIRGNSSQLFRSYLSNRKQYVFGKTADGQSFKSNLQIVKRGVPQGSILGPLLYIIYTNELSGIVGDTVQFADDTTIVFSESKNKNVSGKIFNGLSLLENWFTSHNLLLNVDKTKLIKFQYSKEQESHIFYNGIDIVTSVRSACFLGIEVDYRLDWSQHIDTLASKISSYCFALKIIAINIDITAAKIVYHAYVHSRLRYGIVFWGGSSEIGRILVLQKRCIRNMFGMSTTETCRTKFIENRIMTAVSTYIYECLIFVKENPDLFVKHNRKHHHNTRCRTNLRNIKCKFSFIQRNVQFNLIKIYNRIPGEIRQLNYRLFKGKIKSVLIGKAYYSIREYFDDSVLWH